MSTLFEADLKGGADPEMELDHLESDPEFETLQSLESYPNLEGETWQEQEGMAEPEYGLQELEDEVDLEDQEFSLGGLFKRVASFGRSRPRRRYARSQVLSFCSPVHAERFDIFAFTRSTQEEPQAPSWPFRTRGSASRFTRLVRSKAAKNRASMGLCRRASLLPGGSLHARP